VTTKWTLDKSEELDTIKRDKKAVGYVNIEERVIILKHCKKKANMITLLNNTKGKVKHQIKGRNQCDSEEISANKCDDEEP